MRTASGIANYHKFHKAEFTVFIEGKVSSDSDDEGVVYKDIRYYRAVLTVAANGRNPKIKCVGNKDVALQYAKKIADESIPRSFVIIDKDLEGVSSSPILLTSVIRTYGYSWENELWTSGTIVYVISELTGDCGKAAVDAIKYSSDLLRKVKYLSALDAAAQVDGSALLKKSSSLCGVAFTFPTLSSREVTRISEKFRVMSASSCEICMAVARIAASKNADEVIQGHFWSSIAMRLISSIYKKYTNDTPPSNGVLENLAISGVSHNAEKMLGTSLLEKYRAELVRIGI